MSGLSRIGEHYLGNYKYSEPPYYGCVGMIIEYRECSNCGRTWMYGTCEASIAKTPCLPNKVAMATYREMEKLLYQIEAIKKDIERIQEGCPHQYTEIRFVSDNESGGWDKVICRVCNKQLAFAKELE